MSDEHEDAVSSYQQFVEAQQAMNESVSHEVHLWLEQQDDEALDKIGSILWAGLNFQGWGAQMLGILQYMRKAKFSRCVVCGKNHDAEQQALVEEEHAKMTAEGTAIPGSPFHMGDADAFEAQASKIIGLPTYPEFLKKCFDYNVKASGDQTDPVFCKTCNMRYRDLEDRMLKAPDECPGCWQYNSTGHKFPEPDKQ